MSDINRNLHRSFERSLLALVHADVKDAFPQIKHVIKAAGVTQCGFGGVNRIYYVEIRVPGLPRYKWVGRAASATVARADGWYSFLCKYGPDKDNPDD